MAGARLAACVAALLVALALGCGGSSQESDLARFASPGTLVWVEAELQPGGVQKANADALAKRLAGVDSFGELVVSELEGDAQGGGAPLDFEVEVEPWLGEEGGVAFERLVAGGLSDPLIAVRTTDPEAAQAFVKRRVGEGDAVDVIDDVLVIADDAKALEAATDASEGESLADEDRFQTAFAAASEGGLVNLYVDIGGILEQSEDRIDPQARRLLRSAGIDPSEATAVASVIPRSDRIEIDVGSDLGGEKAPAGDVSGLLGALPADAVAAFAFSGFSEQLEEAADSLDRAGIPPDIGPGELNGVLAQVGVDLEGVAGSLSDGAVFVEGGGRGTLGGALVLVGKSSEAADAIGALGALLRATRIPGITAVSGRASGFSIRSDELGEKPLVVIGKGKRVAIGYGAAAALKALDDDPGPRLGDTAGFEAASKALAGSPISAYVDGPAALRLAEALAPRSESDFWELRKWLRKVTWIGISTGNEGDLATAKLVAGIGGK